MDKVHAEGVIEASVDAVEETLNPIGLNSKEMHALHKSLYERFHDFITEGVYDDVSKDEYNTLPKY
jgi:hypothetical protein